MFRKKCGVVSAGTNGVIQSVNTDLVKMFGYDREDELVGKNLSVLCPEPYRSNYQEYMERYERTKVPRVLGRSRVVEGRRKDLSVFQVQLSVSRSEVDGHVVYIGALEEVEHEVITLYVALDGTVERVKGRASVFGYSQADYMGSSVSRFLCDTAERESIMAVLREALSAPANQKASIIAGASSLQGNRNVQIVCRQGTSLSAALRLRYSARKALLSFRLTPITQGMEAIVMVDGAGVIQDSNEHAELLLGFSRTQLLGRPLRRILPTPHARVFEMLRKLAAVSLHNQSTSNSSISSPKSQSSTSSLPSEEGHSPDSPRGVVDEIVLVRCADRSLHHASCASSIVARKGGAPAMLHLVLSDIQPADRVTSNPSGGPGDGEVALGGQIGQYLVQGDLGSGFFGTVRRGIHVITQQPVAIKTLRKKQYEEVKMQYPPREVELLQALRHPNIMRLYESILTADRMYLITEHIDGGDFFEYLEKKDRLSEMEMRVYFRQMVSAVMYMHDVGVVHRDLKPENMLMTKQGTLKIIDLGLGNFFKPGELLCTYCGSLDYAAPELWLGQRYRGPPVDVWSLGVVLYLSITGFLPFGNTTRILNGLFTWPDDVVPSSKLRDLVRRMLIVEPAQRITMEEVRTHPWTTEGCSESIRHCTRSMNPVIVSEKVMTLLAHQGMPVDDIRKSVLSDARNSLSAIYYMAEKSYASSQTDSAVRAGCVIQ